jgi:hypothetical protein
MKLYVANVGVNKSDADKRGIKSPIFYDGTFEFIPIKGSKADSKYTHHKYDNLPCFNSPKLSLAHYVGPKHADYAVHNDPEFVTFTYGDINTARGSNLRNIQKDDVLLFLARLFDYSEGAGFSQTSRFYFVGYLTIDYALEFTGGVRNTKLSVPDDVKGNAHYVRRPFASRRLLRSRQRLLLSSSMASTTPNTILLSPIRMATRS